MIRILKVYLALLLSLPLCGSAVERQPKAVHYPGKTWEVVASPEELGLSKARLEEAKAFSRTIDTDAVMVVVDGKVAYQWGDVDRKINLHSVRKSIISAMYGKYVKNGRIKLDATLADLGIDDVQGLTEEEKKATVRDLLKFRSGVYHPALNETEIMKRRKPARHAHKAGTHWYYNNWDFNVLGAILRQAIKKNFFETLYEDISKPIGMEDHQLSDGREVNGQVSIHTAYPLRLSARDLARFGWLMLNEGRWNGVQVVDSDWVKESTRAYSTTNVPLYGYGYLWWAVQDTSVRNLPLGSYSARGSKGQFLMIIPAYNMLVVHRCDSSVRDRSVSGRDWHKLLEMILDARV